MRPNRLPNLEIAEIQTVSIAPKNGACYLIDLMLTISFFIDEL
jgi:hypothetical protein